MTPCPLRHRSLRIRSRQLLCRIGDGLEIRRVEIIFSGDADQGEKRIPPGIGECGSPYGKPAFMDAMRLRDSTRRSYRSNLINRSRPGSISG